MKRLFPIAALMLATVLSHAAFAANPQAPGSASQKPTVAAVYDKLISAAEKEVVDATDAMPEDKFNFAPTTGNFKGVRTFAQQAKHIAAVNYIMGAAILNEKPPVDVGEESGPANVTSKADVM